MGCVTYVGDILSVPCDWIMGASAAEEGLTGMTKQHGTSRD